MKNIEDLGKSLGSQKFPLCVLIKGCVESEGNRPTSMSHTNTHTRVHELASPLHHHLYYYLAPHHLAWQHKGKTKD